MAITRTLKERRSRLALGLAIMLVTTAVVQPTFATPSGGSVEEGSAIITLGEGTLTIDQSSDRAVIDWQSFSIQEGETTRFNQPNSQSATLNRVIGETGSQIDGLLEANGQIFLINPRGILIGSSGVIEVGGFVGSTLDVSNEEFMAGGVMTFSGETSEAVINQGTITALDGDVFLIGSVVENTGNIEAASGTVGLAGGTEVILSPAGDQKLAVSVDSGDGKVVNSGTIRAVQAELKAAGGNLYALAIENSGEIHATGVENRDGRVFLKANAGEIVNSGTISAVNADGSGGLVRIDGPTVTLAEESEINVDGTAGGQVVIGSSELGEDDVATEVVDFQNGALVSAHGIEGAGGMVDIWAEDQVYFDGGINATGAPGTSGGDVQIGTGGEIYASGEADLTAVDGEFGTLRLQAPQFSIESTDEGFISLASDIESFEEDGPDTSILIDSWVSSQLDKSNLSIESLGGGDLISEITVSGFFEPVAIEWAEPTTLELVAADSIRVGLSGFIFGGEDDDIFLGGGDSIVNTYEGDTAFDAIVLQVTSAPEPEPEESSGIAINGLLEASSGSIRLVQAADPSAESLPALAIDGDIISKSGDVVLQSDQLAIGEGGQVSTGGDLNILPHNSEATIGIGDEASGQLAIDDGELAQLSASQIIFGGLEQSGEIDVQTENWSNPVSFASTGGILLPTSLDGSEGGAFSFIGPAVLRGDTTVTTQTGDIVFGDSVEGQFALDVDSGFGRSDFLGAVGGEAPLTRFTVVTGEALDIGAPVQADFASFESLGAITLDNPNNNIGTLGPVSRGGPFTYIDADDLNIAGLLAGSNTANDVLIRLLGSDLTLLPGAQIVATGAGNITLVAYGLFDNQAGPSALSVQNGRWLIYTSDPATTNLGGLTGATGFAGTFPALPPFSSSGVLFASADPNQPNQLPPPPDDDEEQPGLNNPGLLEDEGGLLPGQQDEEDEQASSTEDGVTVGGGSNTSPSETEVGEDEVVEVGGGNVQPNYPLSNAPPELQEALSDEVEEELEEAIE